jgi:hypothetical protein
MIGLLKKLFGSKPAEQTAEVSYKVEVSAPDSAPYNVPEPAATTIIPLVVEQAPAPKAEPKKKAAPVKKAAPKKPATAKKPPAPKKPKAKPVA